MENGTDVYKLDVPGEFNFRNFLSFCDEITEGVSPFNKLNFKCQDEQLFGNVIRVVYNAQCTTMIYNNIHFVAIT